MLPIKPFCNNNHAKRIKNTNLSLLTPADSGWNTKSSPGPDARSRPEVNKPSGKPRDRISSKHCARSRGRSEISLSPAAESRKKAYEEPYRVPD